MDIQKLRNDKIKKIILVEFQTEVLLLSRYTAPMLKKITDKTAHHKPFVNKDLNLEKKPSFSGSLFFQATIAPKNGNNKNDNIHKLPKSFPVFISVYLFRTTKEIVIKNQKDTIFPNILEGAYTDERFFTIKFNLFLLCLTEKLFVFP